MITKTDTEVLLAALDTNLAKIETKPDIIANLKANKLFIQVTPLCPSERQKPFHLTDPKSIRSLRKKPSSREDEVNAALSKGIRYSFYKKQLYFDKKKVHANEMKRYEKPKEVKTVTGFKLEKGKFYIKKEKKKVEEKIPKIEIVNAEYESTKRQIKQSLSVISNVKQVRGGTGWQETESRHKEASI